MSFQFICKNLEENIYIEEPWNKLNWKYAYGRVIFFYLIDLFIHVNSNRIRNSIVSLSKQYIVLVQNINKEFSKGIDNEATLENIYNNILQKYDKKLNVRLIKLIKNIHKYNLTYRYNVKFKEFLDFVSETFSVIEDVFNGVHIYCTQSNDIFEENLYRGHVKYLV